MALSERTILFTSCAEAGCGAAAAAISPASPTRYQSRTRIPILQKPLTPKRLSGIGIPGSIAANTVKEAIYRAELDASCRGGGALPQPAASVRLRVVRILRPTIDAGSRPLIRANSAARIP